jgi:hypothetical protein
MKFPEIINLALPGEGFNRAWPPLIKMDAALRKKIGVFGKE